jgi:hypothetical protein
MSTEEDCVDDTIEKCGDLLLYCTLCRVILSYSVIHLLHNTIYLYRKSTVKSLQLIIGEGAAKAHICPSLGPICNCWPGAARGGGWHTYSVPCARSGEECGILQPFVCEVKG